MYNYILFSNRISTVNSIERLNPEIPTLILLRGLSRSYKSWMSLPEELSEYFNVICIDLPGVGLSANEEPLFSIQDIAKKMLEVINYINPEKIFFVSPSISAMITLELVQLLPLEKIKGLVLMSPSHSGVGLKRLTPFAIKVLSTSPMVSKETKVKNLYQMMVGKLETGDELELVNPERYQKWAEYMLEDENTMGIKGQIAQSFSAISYTSLKGLEYIRLNEIPTRFLIPTNDRMIPVAHMEKVYTHINNENSELIYMKRCGHDIVTTHQERLKEIIINLVNDSPNISRSNIPETIIQKKSTKKLWILGIIFALIIVLRINKSKH